MILKVGTTVKERYQQLLDFIIIDVLKIEQQHSSSHDIITLPTNQIINSYFNKHLMKWELIHCRLLQPSEIFMKSMCRHQTLNGLPKDRPKKLKKALCPICYTAKMTTLPKRTIVDTSNIHP